MQLELPNPDLPTPVPVDRLLALAAAAAQAQRRDEAQALLQQAIAENPTSPAAWLACAALATDPVERLTYLDRAIALEPRNARTRALAARARTQVIAHYSELGLAAVRRSDTSAARQCYGEVIRLDPMHEGSWLRLASLAETPEEQIALLKQTLRVNPANERTRASLVEAEQQLARLYLRQAGMDLQSGRTDAARETLRRAVQLDPRCDDAWSLLALTSSDPAERRACAERLKALRTAPPPEPVVVLEPLAARDVDEEAAPPPVGATASPEAPAPPMAVATPFVDAAVDDAAPAVPEAPATPEVVQTAGPATEDPHEDDSVSFEPVAEPPAEVHGHAPEAAHAAAPVPAPSSPGSPAVAEPLHSEATQAEPAPADPTPAVDTPAVATPTAAPPAPAPVAAPPARAAGVWHCPLCETPHGAPEPVCSACGGITTLDEMATLLKPRRVNQPRLDAAVARLESAAGTALDDPFALGLALLNVRRYADGLAQLERAVARRPDDAAFKAAVDAVIARLRPARPAEAPPRATVLVVDDSPTIRRVVASKLEKLRCRVVLAEDGAQALTLLKATVPDLILLDITMPNVDGYQVCKIVKSQPETRHVPVVFISGKDGFFDKARGRMAGSDAYVTKPFGPDALSRVLTTFVPV